MKYGLLNKKRGLLAVVMALAMVFAGAVFVADEADAGDATTYYVGGEGSSDETGDGSEEKPFATIARALADKISGAYVIELCGDVEGDGVEVKGYDLTINFNDYTFEMTGTGVGSSYDYQVFQLHKGTTVVFNDGTVKTEKSDMWALIQNYSDLTLNDMVLDGSKLDWYGYAATISNNSGCLNILGSTSITASGIDGAVAFDACFSSEYYPDGTRTTVDTTGTISGDIEVGDWEDKVGNNPSKTVLKVDSANIIGNIIFTTGSGSGVEIASGIDVDVVIPEGKQVKGSVKIGDASVSFANLKAGFGGITLSEGSVTVIGSIDASSNPSIGGTDVVLENTIITGTGTITIPADVIVKGSVTVPQGVILKTEGTGKIIIAENSTLNVAGSIDAASNVVNNGTISVTTIGAVIPDNIDGTGSVDTSAVAAEGTLSGTYDTDTTFTKNQTITLTADTYLVEDTVFIIKGKLIIPEGVTLYIQDTARLIVTSSTGVIENNGAIIVESKVNSITVDGAAYGAGALVAYNGTMVNNGTIALEYDEDDTNPDVSMNIGGKFTNNGEITVGEDAFLYINTVMTNSADSAITVNGKIQFEGDGAIVNMGDIVLDGADAPYGLLVNLASADAKVEVVSVTTNGDVDDVCMFVNAIEAPLNSAIEYIGASEVVISVPEGTVFGGATIAPFMLLDEDDDGDKQYVRCMSVTGTIGVEAEAEATVGTVTVGVLGTVVIDGDVSIGNDVALGIGTDSELVVNGNLSVLKGTKTGGINGAADAEVYVNGKITTDAHIEGPIVNAASYDVTEGTNKTYYYTTLAQAVTDGATKIAVTGTIEVASDINVPNGVTITNSGTGITIADDATVSFATGAVYKGDAVTNVDGTLYFEDRKSGIKATGNIVSEVVSEGEKDKTFTSLSNALATAAEGDVIKLSGTTHIDMDTTIPVGVSVDNNGQIVCICKNSELTIDGTLLINGGTVTVEKVAPGSTDEDGEIVLNGTVKSPAPISETLEIAGAYYSITAKGVIAYYVEPVSVAAPKIADVDALTIIVKAFDSDLKVGDVAFAGTADVAANVKVIGKIDGSIALDLASISFDGSTFAGKVSNGTGTVALDGTTGTNLVVSSTTKDDAEVLSVTGGFTVTDSKKTVTVTGDVVFEGFDVTSVKVDGNLSVSKNSKIGVLDVDGTVDIAKNATLEVVTANVFGTVTVAEENGTKGTFDVTDLFLGITAKQITASAASVQGNTIVDNQMFVLAGSSFPEELVDENTPYAELYVEGKLWLTIYAFGSDVDATVGKIPVENVQFNGWAKKENGTSNDMTVLIDGTKYYASIKYDIYTVKFVVSEGVDDVYLDGVLVGNLSSGVSVATGTHTVSYTLANGYAGEAKMLVDGKEVSGYTNDAEGASKTYNIILQGIEKAPAETAPVVEEDEGLALTDILLIILVVLIVIMAVIVALRMMRS